MTEQAVEVEVKDAAQMTPFELARERVSWVRQFVKECFVEGEDYQQVQGFGKPTLLKPGAQKLMAAFGLGSVIKSHERFLQDNTLMYEVQVTVINKDTGQVEAEGVGSCNSGERRYRNQTISDVANTVLKMAKKRALVDAVIDATGVSVIFTQDIEDMAPPAPRRQQQYQAPPQQQYQAPPQPVQQQAPQNPPAMTGMGPAEDAVLCPKCNGDMYDQRKSQFYGNGVAASGRNKPMWKCKDKGCDGVVWPSAKQLAEYQAIYYAQTGQPPQEQAPEPAPAQVTQEAPSQLPPDYEALGEDDPFEDQ